MLLIVYFRHSCHKVSSESLNLMRVSQYILPGFAAQLLAICYGPDAFKITLAGNVTAYALAIFGFSYSLAAVIQRYMPINILSGIFRPVFVAASTKNDADIILPQLVSLIIKINWFYIIPFVCVLFFSGDMIASVISGGKYPEAGNVLTVIVLGLLPLAMCGSISMYCLAKEIAFAPLVATAVSVIGLPIAMLLGKYFNDLGVAIAFGLSQLIWSVVCWAMVSRNKDLNVELDVRSFIYMLIIMGVAIYVSYMFILLFNIPSWVGSFFSLSICCTFFIFTLSCLL
ncbi:hypothetical protein [Deefgea sp. CFH1-16]|uniref:hypothetical protein n=1 Tax=Deefgea sp. CFH1-16 TaxID=2675457 RepID=UPI00194024A4|nr:hypothetical protein [Deefgea sp. CFH1-16]